jgi:hypothetical protein
MWENTVITNAGIELLKNALSGGTITVTAIKSGAGKVDVSALKSQTAVSSIKQSGTVQGVTKTNETIKIGVLFSNAGLSAGYSMTQLGIYAKGSTGSEVLFAISQSTTGKEVPAESAMPSWSLVHNFYIKLNNDVTMTATVDPEGYVTFETMQTALNKHTGNKSNPHSVTKSQVGLGNVPNVATNDQTPTYSDTTTLVTLSSGEKISIAFAKIKLAITTLINHLANKSNPHGVTKSQVGLGNVENKSSATIRGELTKGNVTTALGYTPPTQDTNTWRGIQNNLTSDATDQSLSAAQGKNLNTSLTRHTGNKTNPHGVTKSQIGLGNVENKSSATIRSEITDDNVATALGYTPANHTDMTNVQNAIKQLNSEIKNKVYMQPAWLLTCEKFEGGYFKINNVVFLNIRLKTSATNNNWSGSGTWKQIFKNLPKPLIEIPLQCYCETYSDKYTPCYISTDGNAYVMGANQIEPGTIYLFQAVYLSNE